MSILRLDKYLADSGIGSRSDVKKLLRKGSIRVNGEVVTAPEHKIDSETDEIQYQDILISRKDLVYYLLNKPAGYISATQDPDKPTVLSLIHDATHHDLFPVGRLDKDTEGLLLITNDGALSHALLSPKRHVDKTYYVETDSKIDGNAVSLFQKGLDIGDDTLTLPAELTIVSPTSAYITIQEGRYHQVKRMFHVIGCEVTYLKRIRMGSLTLTDDLPIGQYRSLTEEELSMLKK